MKLQLRQEDVPEDLRHYFKPRKKACGACFVCHIVEVFREVRRVLRKDGVLWLNIGDSYAAAANGRSAADTRAKGSDDRTWRDKPFSTVSKNDRKPQQNTKPGATVAGGLKPKDLIMMPARVALALQAEGWWVRSDCIWAKKNPLPSSVKDRPALSHEYVFLLTRSERYYYDSIAVREPAKYGRRTWLETERFHAGQDGKRLKGRTGGADPSAGRNLRTVWSLATQPLQGKSFGVDVEHFAAFPERLVEPCILAGSSAYGRCSVCSAPWERETVTGSYGSKLERDYLGKGKAGHWRRSSHCGADDVENYQPPATLSWRPTCRCSAPVVPCRVLDPFIGSGTVAVVAQRHGRDCIGVDLSADYLRLAEARIQHNLNRPPRRPKRERIPPTEQPALFDI